MSFQGRSPFNDVVRSVLLGAAMITPAALIACAGSSPPPADPTTVNVPPPTQTSSPDPTPVATNDVPDAAAPDNSVVRPRTPDGTNQMPMRGFTGAARPRLDARRPARSSVLV